jgi:hypothetical protein
VQRARAHGIGRSQSTAEVGKFRTTVKIIIVTKSATLKLAERAASLARGQQFARRAATRGSIG